MIIEPTSIEQKGVQFHRLEYEDDFWAVGHTSDGIIKLLTPEEEPMERGTIISSQLKGFGATSYQELLDEIERRGLKHA